MPGYHGYTVKCSFRSTVMCCSWEKVVYQLNKLHVYIKYVYELEEVAVVFKGRGLTRSGLKVTGCVPKNICFGS